jgi:hypothetical protein
MAGDRTDGPSLFRPGEVGRLDLDISRPRVRYNALVVFIAEVLIVQDEALGLADHPVVRLRLLGIRQSPKRFGQFWQLVCHFFQLTQLLGEFVAQFVRQMLLDFVDRTFCQLSELVLHHLLDGLNQGFPRFLDRRIAATVFAR